MLDIRTWGNRATAEVSVKSPFTARRWPKRPRDDHPALRARRSGAGGKFDVRNSSQVLRTGSLQWRLEQKIARWIESKKAVGASGGTRRRMHTGCGTLFAGP